MNPEAVNEVIKDLAEVQNLSQEQVLGVQEVLQGLTKNGWALIHVEAVNEVRKTLVAHAEKIQELEEAQKNAKAAQFVAAVGGIVVGATLNHVTSKLLRSNP